MKNEMLLLLGCWLRTVRGRSHTPGVTDTLRHRRHRRTPEKVGEGCLQSRLLLRHQYTHSNRCKGMLIMLLRRRSRPRDWARARDCSPVAQHKRHPTSPLPTSPLPTSAPLALPTPLQSRTHTAVRGAPTTTLRDAELISGHQGAAERRARAHMTRSAHHDARERQGGPTTTLGRDRGAPPTSLTTPHLKRGYSPRRCTFSRASWWAPPCLSGIPRAGARSQWRRARLKVR
jgi:hypothetical protein